MLTNEDIEKEVQKILFEAGVISPPVVPKNIARRLKLEVIPSDFADDDVCGVLVVGNGSGVIGYNKEHHPHRTRFSIAHEIGHYVLHVQNKSSKPSQQLFVDRVNSISVVFFRDDRSTKGLDRQEIEANAFAAALLMPRNLVAAVVGNDKIALDDEKYIQRLAKKFGVSALAMTYRLGRLYASNFST